MTDLLRLLAEYAPLLVVGGTLLLSLGCGAALICKSPVHRQRIAELTIVGVLGWSVLALVPLPRLLPEGMWTAERSGLDSVNAEKEGLAISGPLETPLTGTTLPENQPVENQSLDVTELLPPSEIPFAHLPQQTIPELDSAEPSIIASPSEEVTFPTAATTPPIPPAPIAPAATQFDWTKLLGLITGAYLAGASLCLLWILAGYVLLVRIRQTADASPDWLNKLFRKLARQSGIAPPQLIVSELTTRPITWGVFWPVVVLPRSLCRPENKSQLETILLHELGHIAQQDAQGNLLFCAALPLLYAHPLYWWLRRDSQLAAELVADDWAAQQTGKETYIEELVALAKCTGTSSLPLVGVTGLFSSPSQFYRRMHMLLAREKPLCTRASLPWRLASLSALAAAVVLAASLAGVRPAIGQAPPSTTPPAVAPAPVPPTPAAEPPAAPEPPTAPEPDAAPAPSGTTPAIPVPTFPTAPRLPPLPGAAPPAIALPAAVPPPATTPPADPNAAATGAGAVKEVDADEAALLKEIEQLKAKLADLEQKRRPDAKAWSAAGIKTVNVRPGTVQIYRVDEKGVHWSEVWATDEKGTPTKIITKSAHNTFQPNLLNDGRVSRDGKTIVRESVEKDGIRVTTIIDAATGKTIAETRTGGGPRYAPPKEVEAVPSTAKPGKAVVERRAIEPAAENVPATPKFPNPSMVHDYRYGTIAPQPAGVPAIGKGDQQLDLVSLATSYADAVSAVESAEVKLDEISKLADSKTISQQEVVAAKLALSAAKRKEQLLRGIAEVATHSAAEDFERTSALYKAGSSTSAGMGEAKARLDILKQILGTRPAEKGPAKP